MGQDRAAFAGQIADLPVPELIRTVTGGGQSGVVHFETSLGTGTLWFRDGELVDADMGRLRMEAAVERLSSLDNGTFEVEFKPIARHRTIETPTTELLARLFPGVSPRAGPRRPLSSTETYPDARREPVSRGRTRTLFGVPVQQHGPAPTPPALQLVPDGPKVVDPTASGDTATPSGPQGPLAARQTQTPHPVENRAHEHDTSPRVAGIAHATGLSVQPTPPTPEPGAPAPVATSDSRPRGAPAVVGRYEVLLRIARGGMGTVYLSRVTGEGGFRRLFALKVIRDHLSQNHEYVQMLLQEARIASRLHHPNVVGIVDIGTLANQHYLVMDYVEGCTFSELLKIHRKTRPPQLIAPIMLDALTGLHAAHTLVDDDGSPLTLVHCDFSPQNMLVGTNGICRITDFGVAKAANMVSGHSGVTRGKPAYLSPEQVLGRRIDHRSDIFSAGVVLWNALTGEQLFAGETPDEIIRRVLNAPVPPPSMVGLRPPSAFDDVALRALEREPEKRYQSAEDMLIDLRRVAITEDYLAPASEVARWVTTTFGHHLELRRRAAGVSKPPGPDSQPIAVPELGVEGASSSQTHLLAQPGGGSGTAPAEESMSRTRILRSEHTAPRQELLRPIQRAVVLSLAATSAAAAIVIGLVRPDWLRGGAVNEYGSYVEKKPRPVGTAETEGADAASDTDGAVAEAGSTGGHMRMPTQGETVEATDTDASRRTDDEPEEVRTDSDPEPEPPVESSPGETEALAPAEGETAASAAPRPRGPKSRRERQQNDDRPSSGKSEPNRPAAKPQPASAAEPSAAPPTDVPDLTRLGEPHQHGP